METAKEKVRIPINEKSIDQAFKIYKVDTKTRNTKVNQYSTLSK